MNVLFLQPREYFEELIEIDHFFHKDNLYFGYPPFLNVEDFLKKYDVVVSCIEHDKFTRQLCMKAKLMGLKVIFFQDGVFDFANSYNNPFLKRKRINLHEYDCYTEVFFTDFTAKDYFGDYSFNYKTFWPKRMLSNVASVKVNKRQDVFSSKILISTAKNPAFDDKEYQRLIALINDLIDTLESMGIECFYRIYDQVLIDTLKIDNDKNMILMPFEDCIKQGYSALFTTPSSIVNIAASMGIPVAIFDYRSTPIMSVAGWRIHRSVEIEEVIASMLRKDIDQLSFQYRMLPATSERPSIDRLCKVNVRYTGFEYFIRFFYKLFFIRVFNVKRFLKNK